LIFVIVILGILAAVAIPKLAATRDDAKVSAELTNLSTAINDIATHYTAAGSLDINATNASFTCFTIASDANSTGITVAGKTTTESFCSTAVSRATAKGLLGTHTFAGSKVVY
jgi:general secretion pathway protein G